MLSKIPNEIQNEIIAKVEKKFNAVIEEDIIDFLQDFQSKIAVEEGFAKEETVRLYGLAVFKFNPKKVDSRSTMKRLLAKHKGDSNKALDEFKELGKLINIKEKTEKAEAKKRKVSRPKKHEKVFSKDGLFTAR